MVHVVLQLVPNVDENGSNPKEDSEEEVKRNLKASNEPA